MLGNTVGFGFEGVVHQADGELALEGKEAQMGLVSAPCGALAVGVHSVGFACGAWRRPE
jgi:hypothetical protein